MISLIIFDFWKTLAYRDVPESSTKQMLRLTNSSIPHKEFVKIFESALQTKKWDSKFDAYAHLCEKMGLPVTQENVNLLISIRDTAEECVKPFDHTLSMLQQLKKSGYKIGIISNSSIFAYEKIKEKTTILDYIDYPLFSFEAGTIKPDLAIYRKMLEITGYQPEETIMIGDNQGDDVLPPRELGMHSCLFENYEQLKKDLKPLGIILQ